MTSLLTNTRHTSFTIKVMGDEDIGRKAIESTQKGPRVFHQEANAAVLGGKTIPYRRSMPENVTQWAKSSRRTKAGLELGATMVEYALIVVLIALVAMVAISVVGQKVSSQFSAIASSL